MKRRLLLSFGFSAAFMCRNETNPGLKEALKVPDQQDSKGRREAN